MATIAERITELREKRARIDTEQRELLDTATSANRGLTAEEREKDDKLTTDFDSTSDELRRLERQDERDKELRTVPKVVLDEGGEDTRASRKRADVLGSDEYRAAVDHYVRFGLADMPGEMRSNLQAGTDADGGVTVAETWRKQLIERLREFSAVRSFAEVITTETGGDFHLPRVSADATATGIIDEGTTIPDDAEAFDEVVLKAWKYAKITKANDEAVQDLGFDVAGFVTRRIGEDIALAQGGHFTLGGGSGSSQPQGLISGATVGKTTAAPTALTTDEVFDLIYSVTRPYRINGRLMGNDQTIAAVRKLKDSTGQYLWSPGLQVGEPDSFSGYKIEPEPFMDTIAATKVVLGFGDVFRAYVIRDAGSLTLRYLDQRYADVGQVAWRGTLRSDGEIKDVNAFKTLKMHA